VVEIEKTPRERPWWQELSVADLKVRVWAMDDESLVNLVTEIGNVLKQTEFTIRTTTEPNLLERAKRAREWCLAKRSLVSGRLTSMNAKRRNANNAFKIQRSTLFNAAKQAHVDGDGPSAVGHILEWMETFEGKQ
jgi:hypothetical protein